MMTWESCLLFFEKMLKCYKVIYFYKMNFSKKYIYIHDLVSLLKLDQVTNFFIWFIPGLLHDWYISSWFFIWLLFIYKVSYFYMFIIFKLMLLANSFVALYMIMIIFIWLILNYFIIPKNYYKLVFFYSLLFWLLMWIIMAKKGFWSLIFICFFNLVLLSLIFF